MLERVIMALYQKGIRYYGAGGALGFDAIAAQTVIRLRESCPGMKLILVLPCLTAKSNSILLDIKKKRRSFQHTENKYQSLRSEERRVGKEC